jgi:hypothetical protein
MIVTLSLLVACLTSTAPDAPAVSAAQDPAAAYKAAVLDASTPTAEDVVNTLTVIRAENAALEWEGDAQARVKLLTWTAWDGYDGLVGQDTTLS